MDSTHTNIQVAVRVRPFDARELISKEKCILSMPNSSKTLLLDPDWYEYERGKGKDKDVAQWTRGFAFDHCLWSHRPGDPDFVSQEATFVA